MIRLVLLFPLLGAVSSATAAKLSLDTTPTSGLSGFSTLTFSIETEPGEVLRGVDARFAGPMSQINPFGNSTVFNDLNPFMEIIGEDASHDSQFLFTSGDVLSIGIAESDELLTGAISGLGSLSLPNPTPIARVVVESRSIDLTYDLSFDLGGAQPVVYAGSCPLIGCGLPIDPHNPGPIDPEPAEPSGRLFATGNPTVDLDGLTTYTVFYESPEGTLLHGFDAGFSGPMNQINPADTPTVLQDANAFFPAFGFDATQDSQLIFGQEDILSFFNLSESDESLTGSIVFEEPASQPTPTPIAQITTADPSQIDYSFVFDAGLATGIRFDGTLSGLVIPEPATMLMLGFAFSTSIVRRRGQARVSSR